MIERDDIVTFDRIDGFETVCSFGEVAGAASRTRSRLRSTFRSLGMLIGLAPGEFLGDAEQLRADALEDLRRRAEALGANAVLRLEFAVNERADGFCEVTARGEAVLLRRLDGDER